MSLADFVEKERLRERFLEPIKNGVKRLREIDSKIDFARSQLQLDIVLELALARKPLTADEIARFIGYRKKAVLDAIRKLEHKGLVRRVGSNGMLFELTDEGKRLLEDLFDLLGVSGLNSVARKAHARGRADARDLQKVVQPSYYLAKMVIAIGSSRKGYLSMKELASVVGLSQERLQSYMEPYMSATAEVKLFKKIKKPVRFEQLYKILRSFGIRVSTVSSYVTLTDDGRLLYYRLPVYVKLKHNFAAKLVVKLFGSYAERLVLKKFSILIYTLALLSIVVAVAFPSIGFAVLLGLMLLYVVLSLTLLVAYT
ncbi:MAG TPA: hypothetical protein EYP08_02625 [Pyrodictiaceae archaeon]|nr:hypothetical protein [Pyrodictiaceae archaeon]